ncbi:hypothetical protein EZV62_008099 [Acer yangbiense]|uniref:Transposase MuDR plant domain-containing protein n=1 Tax=Acer yangbiense TaxID=1000413 RepID=A0A5C7ICE0_9ROSI|nr:hypothetical protein EZV62_008099 [Acer yangbiense]
MFDYEADSEREVTESDEGEGINGHEGEGINGHEGWKGLESDDGDSNEGEDGLESDDEVGDLLREKFNVAVDIKRYCARHIYANFRLTYQGDNYKKLFWKESRSCNVFEFKATLNAIGEIEPRAKKTNSIVGASASQPPTQNSSRKKSKAKIKNSTTGATTS